MILHYYKAPTGDINFGDDLNEWLWPKLLPGFFDNDASEYFFGIGTLLSEKMLHKFPQKIIFGIGAGYDAPPVIDESYKIYFVRGPLSAKAIGLPPTAAITDSAYFITRKFKPSNLKKYKYSYMPHHTYANKEWKTFCDDIGVHYIDPNTPVEQILNEISQTEKMITEAMHGAIVADALRIPWIPVVSGEKINGFKWQDWTLSIRRDYSPIKVRPMWERKESSLRSIAANFVKKMINKRVFDNIAKEGIFQLSSDDMWMSLNNQLDDKLDQLKHDYNLN